MYHITSNNSPIIIQYYYTHSQIIVPALVYIVVDVLSMSVVGPTDVKNNDDACPWNNAGGPCMCVLHTVLFSDNYNGL